MSSTVSVLNFYTARVRALCVEEPQLGCICSGLIRVNYIILLPLHAFDTLINNFRVRFFHKYLKSKVQQIIRQVPRVQAAILSSLDEDFPKQLIT